MISEPEAWDIAHAFAAESYERLGAHLVAVVAVGSLASGGYIPGRSDIDLIVVVKDDCPDEPITEIKRMAERYWRKYGFRKGFGGYAVRERDLRPPFGALGDEAFEILQLKQQGRVIWGHLDLVAIAEPSYEDMRRSLVIFAGEIAGAWRRTYPAPIDTDDARVNTILYWLRFFVWDRTGVYILGKRQVLSTFSELAGTEAIFKRLTPVCSYLDREIDHPGSVTELCREVETYVISHVVWVREAVAGSRSG